jgi:hypothetical protein
LSRIGINVVVEGSDGSIDSSALHFAAVGTSGIMEGGVSVEPHFPGKVPQLVDGLAGPDGPKVKWSSVGVLKAAVGKGEQQQPGPNGG